MTVVPMPVEKQVEHVTERLVHDFDGQVEGVVVRQLVQDAYSDFAQAKVQQFVPVLVDRSVRRQLRAR